MSEESLILGTDNAGTNRFAAKTSKVLGYTQDANNLYTPKELDFTRATTATYLSSGNLIITAAANIARTQSNLLLLEPTKTNTALYSEDFSNAAWTKSASSVTANTTTSPSGLTDADKLVESASNAFHSVYFASSSSTGFFTLSCFAKASERNWLVLNIFTGVSGGDCLAWFNLTSGVLGTITNGNGSSITTAAITSIGNSWYRCSITINKTSVVAQNVNIATSTGDNVISYLGNGTAGLFLWGAQFENSTSATSYIPTTASSVTRNADTLNINFNDTATDWTVFFNIGNCYVNDNYLYGTAIRNAAGQNQIILGGSNNSITNPSNPNYFIYNSKDDETMYALNQIGTKKIAIKKEGTTLKTIVNGSVVYTKLNTAITTIKTIVLNDDTTFSLLTYNAVRTYEFALTDAQCISLTT